MYNGFKIHRINFKILAIYIFWKKYFEQKFSKNLYIWPFLARKWPRKIFWFFLVGIGSEWSKTYFKTKNSISNFFPIMTWHSHFFKKWGHRQGCGIAKFFAIPSPIPIPGFAIPIPIPLSKISRFRFRFHLKIWESYYSAK